MDTSGGESEDCETNSVQQGVLGNEQLSTTTEESSHISSSESQLSSEPSHFSSPEIDIDSFLGPEYQPPNPRLLTFRIVGDNIDKNVKPRDMTSEHQTRSLHYFHAYAVRDRIDLSDYSSEPPVPDLGKMNFDALLPSDDDAVVLQTNMVTLIGLVLCKYMPFFAKFSTGLGRHIRHEFYEDMCTKSNVVSTCMY